MATVCIIGIVKAMRPLSMRLVLGWLPLAFVATVLSGLVYAAVQQNIRQTANEPQLQIATDIAVNLQNNPSQTILSSTQTLDIRRSLSPFSIVYNESDQLVTSNAQLDGQAPTPPRGVFDYTRQHGEDRVTWEPRPGVRIATIIEHYQAKNSSGFILVGRNMREVERNQTLTLELTGMAWIVALAGSFSLSVITDRLANK